MTHFLGSRWWLIDWNWKGILENSPVFFISRQSQRNHKVGQVAPDHCHHPSFLISPGEFYPSFSARWFSFQPNRVEKMRTILDQKMKVEKWMQTKIVLNWFLTKMNNGKKVPASPELWYHRGEKLPKSYSWVTNRFLSFFIRNCFKIYSWLDILKVVLYNVFVTALETS